MNGWLRTVVLLLLLVCAFGRQGRSSLITGRVVDDQGRPVKGADIGIFEDLSGPGRWEDVRQIASTARSDEQGAFRIPNVEVRFWSQIFVVARKQGLAFAWMRYRPGALYLQMERSGSMGGTVIDDTGRPVPGVKVWVIPRDVGLPLEWFVTYTDKDGVFAWNRLADGMVCDFWIKAKGWHSQYRYAPAINQFEAGCRAFRVVLPEERPVKGQVVDDQTGEPVAGVKVEIRSKAEYITYCPQRATSDLNGSFVFEGVPVGGPHHLKVIAPSQGTAEWIGEGLDVAVEEYEPFVSVEVPVERGGLLEIKVLDAVTGGGVPNAWVLAVLERSRSRNWINCAATNKSGQVRMRVPPGMVYSMIWRPLNGTRNYQRESDLSGIDLPDGQVRQFEVRLQPLPNVQPLFRDPNGNCLDDVSVTLGPTDNEVVKNRGDTVFGYPDQRMDRDVLVARIPERNLTAMVRWADLIQSQEVILTPGLSILGQVTDGQDQPIHARVCLSLSLDGPNPSDGFEEAVTDDQGRFRITAVPLRPKGEGYRLVVTAKGFDDEAFEIAEEKPGATVDLEQIKLKKRLSRKVIQIQGFAVYPDGSPVRNGWIEGECSECRILDVSDTDGCGNFCINEPFPDDCGKRTFRNTVVPVEAKVGDQSVRVVLQDLPGTDKLAKACGLAEWIGQPLQALMGPDLAQVRTPLDGQSVLLCLWDVEQKGDRRLVRLLAARTPELVRQGMVVVALVDSFIDQEKVTWWVQRYKIPFEVVTVQQEREKRPAWRAKGILPCLILTDKDHVIRWIGTSFKQLQQKVEEIGR